MHGKLTVMEISTASSSLELRVALVRARDAIEALGLTDAYTVPGHYTLYDALNGFMGELDDAVRLPRPSWLPTTAPWPTTEVL